MSGIILRWGVPALVTVVGGTSLAISATSGDIAADLAARSSAALERTDVDWAKVSFDGRDAFLTGTVADQTMIDAAVATVAAVHGVRSVQAEVVVAERVSPFPFVATIRDGVVALSGGVPDATARAEIALMAGATSDELQILSGAPRRELWSAAVAYGLRHLAEFDEGTFELSDLEVSIEGRAKSREAFDALALMSTDPAPAGATVAKRAIAPALASPFEWRAEFDGARVTVSGFTPTEDFAESLRTAGVGGRPVSTSLVLASGAPEGFEQRARLLLENLVLLEEGTADISGDTSTLSGSPADIQTLESIRTAMTREGVALDLAPPRIDGYQLTATRAGDEIVLGGHVPDGATRDRLENIEGINAGALELARGAPERFDSALEFGLALLEHLSEGRVSILDTSISIEGRARTAADFAAIEDAIAAGAPQGLVLAATAVKPPLATPFTWTATRDKTGRTVLAGFVPSRAAQATLRSAAPDATDTSTIADGNPADFEAEAVAALGVLPLLESGTIAYDGERWSLTGAVDTPQAAFAADRAFSATGLREAGWDFELDLPTAAAPVALPIIEPYVWRAEKSREGTGARGGSGPPEALKRVLVGRSGEKVADTMTLGAGHPEGFIAGAMAGLDALLMLDEGTASFDGRTWSLSGQVRDSPRRLEVEAALEASLDASGWQVAIQALDAAPVASPYTWSATKQADGTVSLSGYIPSAELKDFVAVRAGDSVVDATEIASGEPAGFVADVLAGLEALQHISAGSATYSDGAWTIAGQPQTAAAADLALAAIGAAGTSGAAWVNALSPPLVASEPEVAAVAEPSDPAAAAAPEASPVEGQPTDVAALPDAGTPDPASAPEAGTTAEPELAATPETEPAPVVRNFAFVASKPFGGSIALEGAVPADATRRYFGVIAGQVPTEALELDPGLPQDFIPTADAGIRLLAGVDDGRFGLADGTWILEGRVETEAEREAALAAISALPAAATWETSITLLPALEICRQHVASFASRNEILFQSGSARLAEESAAAIDELAGYLGECPDTTVHVEGHTDADGADDLNLALSVARAEAVVEALIERGVAFQRLYAVGYGESLPIADNDTTAGKRANRRIAFAIEEN